MQFMNNNHRTLSKLDILTFKYILVEFFMNFRIIKSMFEVIFINVNLIRRTIMELIKESKKKNIWNHLVKQNAR